jgi:predicted dinucleotide-binding enzyme
MKKVGIIGSGHVAHALATGFKDLGYQVRIGTRDISKLSNLENIEKGTVKEAIDYSNILVLCVKGKAAVSVLNGFDLSNKIIVDTTNPIEDIAAKNGVLQFFTQNNHSLMETLQETYPAAHFVKAFNSVGSHLMYKPEFNGEKPTMFYCGDNQDAKITVREIIESFGWDALDMGNKESSGALESLCILWCIPGLRENKWQHAFKLLAK